MKLNISKEACLRMAEQEGDHPIGAGAPSKVWIETDLEPRWFGLWHRHVWYVCTPFMRQKFYDKAEAEQFEDALLDHLL